MAAGFNGYITKPIAPEDFVSQTEQFLKRDLRSNGPSPTQRSHELRPEARRGATKATILALDDRQVNHSLIRSILEPMG
jgi:two-component system, cell cycle response regulator